MPSALHSLKSTARTVAYSAFGKLPPRVRRGLVGVLTPSFTVGALAILHDGDKILFVRQLHRPGLALPGGLLKKGESARTGLARELSEEIGVDPTGLAPAPDTAHVDPAKKRVDLIWLLPTDRQQVEVATGSEVLSYEWRTAADGELTPQTKEILAGIASRLP
ncbi:NUDIX domain-containing protein [Nakamurella sp. YIM 132087]|uniref:NUDIX domain-containing protein n=1 Tax=Nakamurella alba TaxID=2665158 RepID=A0A7K1FH99_9ACTN|nr:NUDIX hydrolase [Nakamurella alba]MTD12663.1 NUDIX domain-containing protein [Nakamurella alba]